jgi:hypothetical protein
MLKMYNIIGRKNLLPAFHSYWPSFPFKCWLTLFEKCIYTLVVIES